MESNGVRAAVRLRQLRGRIERWRCTRAKRSPMPADLWTAATELARELGGYRVARETGVGYQSLRDRLGDNAENGRRQASAFVEIDSAALFARAPAAARAEVELSDASGMKVVIRLDAGKSVDVGEVLAAFRATRR